MDKSAQSLIGKMGKGFEHSFIDVVTFFSKYVTLDVFVSENPMWVNIFEHGNEVVEARIKFTKNIRTHMVRFCPMWATVMA